MTKDEHDELLLRRYFKMRFPSICSLISIKALLEQDDTTDMCQREAIIGEVDYNKTKFK